MIAQHEQLEDLSPHVQVTWNEINESEFCRGAARRFNNVATWLKQNGRTQLLLDYLVHSSCCQNRQCKPYCIMFLKNRAHIICAKHPCYIYTVYIRLRHLHASACNGDCPLSYCRLIARKNLIRRLRALRIVSRQG